MNDVFIYDALRSPLGKGKRGGALNEVKPVVLLATVLDALKNRNPTIETAINDVIIGCVTPIGDQGANIAKTALLYTDWGSSIPGMQLNRFSAAGLEAIYIGASKIRSGWEELIVAGGIESMSRIAMGSDGGALMFDPEISIQANYLPQGIGADLVATKLGFSRADLDAFAFRSHEKAYHAQLNGHFDKAIVPILDKNGLLILDKDESIRQNVSIEDFEKLKPSFDVLGKKGFDAIALMKHPEIEQIYHNHTPANSCGIVDGASLILLGNEAKGKKLGLTPKAKIKAIACVGSDPTIVLGGATAAAQKVLEQSNLEAENIDLWEVNETFAAPTLKFQQDFDIPDDKFNVNGGDIAIGYPLGAVGAIILGRLVDELERQNLKTGLVAINAGTGIGMALVIER